MGESHNVIDAAVAVKLDNCRQSLRRLGKVLVAYSGGVDSSLLLGLAVEAVGTDSVLAVINMAPTFARRERPRARKIAADLGVQLIELNGEIDEPKLVANDPRRCYYCKRRLLQKLAELAQPRGMTIVTGDNADDHNDYRPGTQAVRESGAATPLRDAGLTKSEIRSAARSMGLSVWDAPSTACLATRVPYGEPISRERLERIDRAEEILAERGFEPCRVRDHGQVARIEVPAERIAELLSQAEPIVEAIKALGFVYVSVDLHGLRSGSMNDVLGQTGQPE